MIGVVSILSVETESFGLVMCSCFCGRNVSGVRHIKQLIQDCKGQYRSTLSTKSLSTCAINAQNYYIHSRLRAQLVQLVYEI